MKTEWSSEDRTNDTTEYAEPEPEVSPKVTLTFRLLASGALEKNTAMRLRACSKKFDSPNYRQIYSQHSVGIHINLKDIWMNFTRGYGHYI